jgi:hypothetical protein
MNVKAVFDRALEIPASEGRAAYLDSVCDGSPELRAEVEALLQAHSDAGSFLERPAPMAAVDETAALLPSLSTRSTGPAGQLDPDATTDGDTPHAMPSPEPAGVPGYELVGELGRGGMGVVYLANQTPLGRPVALKMLPGGGRADRKTLIRFLAEAEAVAAVRHPHVVQVYDYGEHAGRPYMALEYVPGGSLTQRLGRAKRLAPDDAASLIAKVARGVAAAHDLGIVHRDLKPANVLLDAAGDPRVTDFGLAKRGGGADLTQTQAVMGTPAYMAPEQARGDTKFVTPAADVYALGVMLYECLTGTRPFEADDTLALLRRVAEEEPEPPRRRVPQTPRDLELICLKCLSKDAGDRYPTAKELADDLDRFTNREPVSIRRAGWVERWYRWAKRRPTKAAAYALAVLAAVFGSSAALAVALWRQAEAARSGAVAARSDAEDEKHRAEGALAREQSAREGEVRARDALARSDYTRTVALAQRCVLENNIPRARAQLGECRADLRGWEWGYVNRLAHRDLLTLPLRRIPVSASFSPDGTRVAAATVDATAPVWNLRTGQRHPRPPGLPRPVLQRRVRRLAPRRE